MTCITNMPRTHRVGISAPGAFEPVLPLTIIRALAPVSNSHVWTPEFAEDDGHRGNPWASKEGLVYVRGAGSGPLVLKPRVNELRNILPLLIGGTFAANVLEPAIICDFFRVECDKSISTYDFRDCKTNSWTMSSSSGSPILQLDWNFESGKMVRTAAGTFTAGLDLSLLPPLVHTTCVLTINGNVYKVDDVQVAGSNNLATDIFYNSQTRTDLAMGNQQFTLTTTNPFDVAGDVAIQDLGLASASVAASLVYTSGTTSLTIEFPALHAPVVTPITPAGNTAVRYEGIQWTARTSGAGVGLVKPIKFTLDDTV
jgi:hypothetical protein